MKAQLVKRKNRWDLYAEDGSKSASTAPNPIGKLSIKNCEAIANGYDLEELSDESVSDIHEGQIDFKFKEIYKAFFKEGFLKAMELMDKKFSEEDMLRLAIHCWNIASRPEYGATYNINEIVDNYIQLLQPKEWDVEIEMICPHPEDTYTCGLQYGCDEDGCNHPNQVPYLDKDECLILKRI